QLGQKLLPAFAKRGIWRGIWSQEAMNHSHWMNVGRPLLWLSFQLANMEHVDMSTLLTYLG
ncbi:hypothetical protein B4Q13_22725, partial [Lacticaseibacillus rhamnosus]